MLRVATFTIPLALSLIGKYNFLIASNEYFEFLIPLDALVRICNGYDFDNLFLGVRHVLEFE